MVDKIRIHLTVAKWSKGIDWSVISLVLVATFINSNEVLLVLFDSFDTGNRMPQVEILADYFRVELKRSDILAVRAEDLHQDNFTMPRSY